MLDQGHIARRNVCDAFCGILDTKAVDSFAAALHEDMGKLQTPVADKDVFELPEGQKCFAIDGHFEYLLSDLKFDVLLVVEFERDLATPALNQHVEYVAIFQRLRTTRPSAELDHGLIAIAESEAWKLTTAWGAIKKTDVPALAIGKGHQDLVHDSDPFPWKFGLEGRVLPLCKRDEQAPPHGSL